MAKRTLPGIGLTGFWPLGDSTWKPEMDDNLRLLSMLVGRAVLSRTTVLPGTPTQGDIYIVPSGEASNPNEIAIYDRATATDDPAWVYITPQEGWHLYVQDDNENVQWNGTAWVGFVAADAPFQGMVQSEITANHVVTDADMAGNVARRVNSATAVTLTVNTGLTNQEPCTFIATGAGQVSFVAGAGVSLFSAGTRLKIRTQYSSATLIPDTTNAGTYYIVGDLEA